MKKSLKHLPDYKRRELAEITEIIRNESQPEMIILFGSYARGNWVEDRFTDPEDNNVYEYKSDYDILVVSRGHGLTHNHGLWDKIDRMIREKGIRIKANIIVHNIKELNRKIAKGEYFFCDIKKEGILLFDTKNFKLNPMKKLSNTERKSLAKEDFEHWYKRACDFFRQAEHAIADRALKIAAFDLHQATECFYSTILLVFTQYKPRTHDIETFSHTVCTFDPRLCTIFPRFTEKEKQLFNLLKKAYIDARYKKSYKITKRELTYLSARVEKLQQLTKEICKKRISKIKTK